MQSRLSKLERECTRLSDSQSQLHRDVYELCELVMDIASVSASRRDLRNAAPRDDDDETRLFVVRFNYNPFTMSPNADPESELTLRAGDRVRVFGSADSVSRSLFASGFYAHSFRTSAVSIACGCLLLGVYTVRSSDRPVGPTIVSCKRFVRPVGQTVGCLISSHCRSDCRNVWTLRPTGWTDRPVGRPITLQRRRYLLLTS